MLRFPKFKDKRLCLTEPEVEMIRVVWDVVADEHLAGRLGDLTGATPEEVDALERKIMGGELVRDGEEVE